MSFHPLSIADEKAFLRLDMKAARSQFNESERARASLGLCHSLWPWLLAHKHERVGVYLARSFELSLDPLIEALLESGAQVGAPHVDLKEPNMEFFRFRSLEDVANGPWNVREPRTAEPFSPSVVLVPALALDARGHRLGTGGGWYDRFLSPSLVAIGVAFDFQIVARVPVEDHDHLMNHVWSEKRHFDCCGAN
jgi:5-formyltetrahydrofolate cyclo-ligase